MNQVPTYIIEDNQLMRAGIKSLLENSRFQVDPDITHIDDLDHDLSHSKTIAIISAKKSPEIIIETIDALRCMSQNMRIVILSETLDRNIITTCFSIGADGILLKSISINSLIASLELVMTGEKVFPTSMASIITSGWNNWQFTDNLDLDNDVHFSPRALEIVRCLTNGFSNKVIARNLGITESTVKVHIKAILKKLDLTNRTQVALWAVNQGINLEPKERPTPDNSNDSLNSLLH